MANMDLIVKAWDAGHWEMSEAFKGLPDEDVWKRADPRLLSVGEIAAHVAYWEANSIIGPGFESPLVTEAARYYTSNSKEPFELPLSAAAVLGEVQKVHEAAKAAFLAGGHDSEEVNPLRGTWSWGNSLEYSTFHVAYHTGQMYSVRHLLGHEPVDN